MSTMDNIKDIVSQVIDGLTQRQSSIKKNIEDIWIETLKKHEVDHTKVMGMKDGQILVLVDSSVVLYQMKMRKSNILECLKKEFPDLKNIDFKIGILK